MYLCVFFFFKQKTAYEMRISDWSSDVCSSDLFVNERREDRRHRHADPPWHHAGDVCPAAGDHAEHRQRHDRRADRILMVQETAACAYAFALGANRGRDARGACLVDAAACHAGW